MSARRLAFVVAYGLSGGAALLYEVVWARLLTLHLGQTIAAVSAVLAAFMGGLAIGAAIGGRLGPRLLRREALVVYARLELAIAALAILLPFALAAARPLLAWAYNDGAGATFPVIRVAVSLILVSIPAAAMGATFPVGVRWFVGSADRAGAEAGALYATHAVGAAIGAAGAGFVLLPALGLRATTFAGVAANIVAAMTALLLARRDDALPALQQSAAGSATPEPRKTARKRPLPGETASQPWLAAGAVAVSGFVALVFEVTWTRLLALVVGPTTYAFTTMLVGFIGGLAAGSTVASRWLVGRRYPAVWLGLALMLSAAASSGGGWFVQTLQLAVANAVAVPNVAFESLVIYQAALVAGILLPTTVALGAAFPLALAVAIRRDEAVVRGAALVYTFNTIGAIAGALAAGFLLIPLVGLHGTLVAASVAAVGGGLGVALLADATTRVRLIAACLALVAAMPALLLPEWNRALLSSGAYQYASSVSETDAEAALQAGRLLYYGEGATGTVTVRQVAGGRSLAIDGKVDASNGADMLSLKLLAHLPLLLHPDPKNIAIIGLGSGVTVGAALRHPVSAADVIEISDEVVEASSYFADENRNALSDRRTNLIVGDGRTHLLLASRAYDVIVSEPSSPWMAGVAPLFTREFLQAARDRLAPAGVFCQWAHTDEIRDAELRSVVASFQAVFPDGTAWLVGEADLLLIGSRAPVEPMLANVAAAWSRPGISADLQEVGVQTPFAVLSLYLGGKDWLTEYAGAADVQTDERLTLEFLAPRGIYEASRSANARVLRALARRFSKPPVVAEALASTDATLWRSRGHMQLAAEAFTLAFEDFSRAVRLDPTDPEALCGLSAAAAGAGRREDAIRLLEDIVTAGEGSVAVRLELSRLLSASGRLEDALAWAEDVHARTAGDRAALERIASILADLGDAERLAPVVEALVSDESEAAGSLYYAATLAFLRGHYRDAAALAERVVGVRPSHHRAHNLLGAAYGNLGEGARAREAFLAALRGNPRDPVSHVNLGVFELQAGNPWIAAGYFAEALTLDPQSPVALNGLAAVLEQQGKIDRAQRLRRRALQLTPPAG